MSEIFVQQLTYKTDPLFFVSLATILGEKE